MTDEDDGYDLDGPSNPLPSHSMRRWLMRQGLSKRPLGEARSLLAPLYGGWYRHCIQCGEAVGDGPGLYSVERALRRGEPLFEYAMCESCVYRVQDDLSTQSIDAITEYWLAHYDLDARDRELEDSQSLRLFERCSLSDRRRADCEEYQLFAWMQGDELAVTNLAPGVLSLQVVEAMAERLSRQTRDRLDDFIRDKLGLPPELKGLPVLV